MMNEDKKLKLTDTTLFFSLRVFGGVIVAHLLTSFFAFFASVLEDFLGPFIVNFIITGVGFVLLISYTYGVGWRQGLRDLSLESRGTLKYKSIRGFYAGLFGMAPYILGTAVYTVLFYLNIGTDFKWLPQLLNPEFVLFFDMPYVMPVIYMFLIFTAWLGHSYGYKNISFTKKIMYEKEK